MTNSKDSPPVVLTIAGSDSGGGAGVQADLAAFAAFGAHGLSAITAVTAQNTREVALVHALPAAVVRAQLDAVFADFPIRAVKIGMLATPAIVRAVAAVLDRRPHIPVVLDPVLVATTGASLGRAALVPALRRHLVPRADLLTPNIPEAEALLGRRLRNASEMEDAAAKLIARGARAVLLKGGHRKGPEIADLLLAGGTAHWFRHPRIRGEGHGTGCSLASAIAANLALGRAMGDAVGRSIDYVQRALAAGYRPGRGPLLVLDHSAGARSRRAR